MSNVTDFCALMTKFKIEQVEAAPDHELSNIRCFFGRSYRCGVFVNLAVTIAASSEIEREYDEWANSDEDHLDWRNDAFRVYQRYMDNDSLFSVYGEIEQLSSPHNLLGDNLDDFTKLEQLLSGETLRFHDLGRYVNGEQTNNPDRWIEITLKR